MSDSGVVDGEDALEFMASIGGGSYWAGPRPAHF